MPSNEMENALEEAEKYFESSPDKKDVENGLNVEKPLKIQVRKACRLLEASERLLSEGSGYYLLIIDASFTAIERSIQALLIEKGKLQPEEVPASHTKVYDHGVDIGLLDQDFRERLIQLWNENRSQIYYQKGLPSKDRAQAIHRLAETIHSQTIGMSRKKHLCICSI